MMLIIKLSWSGFLDMSGNFGKPLKRKKHLEKYKIMFILVFDC